MSLETFDNELDEHYNEDENNCNWCNAPIALNKQFCSSTCQMFHNG